MLCLHGWKVDKSYQNARKKGRKLIRYGLNSNDHPNAAHKVEIKLRWSLDPNFLPSEFSPYLSYIRRTWSPLWIFIRTKGTPSSLSTLINMGNILFHRMRNIPKSSRMTLESKRMQNTQGKSQESDNFTQVQWEILVILLISPYSFFFFLTKYLVWTINSTSTCPLKYASFQFFFSDYSERNHDYVVDSLFYKLSPKWPIHQSALVIACNNCKIHQPLTAGLYVEGKIAQSRLQLALITFKDKGCVCLFAKRKPKAV